MKGSPIIATVIACLIMLGMYVGMRIALTEEKKPITEPEVPAHSVSGEVNVYVDIYFSSQPKNFSLTHPASGKVLLKVANPGSAEWSDNVSIPLEKLTSSKIDKMGEIELLGKVEWQAAVDGHQFMQVIISPDDLDPQTATLRADGNITDILYYHWKEDE